MNRLQLIGRLGGDPEVKDTAVGLVASFSVATHEYSKDRETGQTQVHTEWHEVVCFDKLAQLARDALRKGIEVFVEGRVRTRKWTDKEGKERIERELRVDAMKVLRVPKADLFAKAVAQLEAIEQLSRALHAGNRGDATTEDVANMIASVRETLTEGK